MPIAIIVTSRPTITQILTGATDAEVLASLCALDEVPTLHSIDDARLWLLAQPFPSGWYHSAVEARARLLQDRRPMRMGHEELAAIRAELSLSRAAFAEELGFTGSPNTRHKQVWEMERARKPILSERARFARTLLALERLPDDGLADAYRP